MAYEVRDPSPARTVLNRITPCKQTSSAPARRDATLSLTPVTPTKVGPPARPLPCQWLHGCLFAPSRLPDQLRQPAAGYVFAVLAQVLAVALTRMFAAIFPPFGGCRALVVLGVVLVALNWGTRPSLVSATVGALLFEYTRVPMPLSWRSVGMGSGVALALLMGVGVVMGMLAGFAERSKRRAFAERAAAQARECATYQVQERMDELLATAGHDLRSPLTAAIGFNDLAAHHYERLASTVLDARPDLADQVRRVRLSLNDAMQSEERLVRLVALMFDTAQVHAGKLEVHRVPCDLTEVVRDNAAALRMANPHRTLHLEVLVEEPVRVVADADRIGQVVTNYVSNAMRYSNEDQSVGVRLAVDGACATVSVRDYGPGLPARELDSIWQRFYQAEGVRVQYKSGAGLGLGLHICKTIIEGHDGEVGVESVVGQGSTFWFTLPLADTAS